MKITKYIHSCLHLQNSDTSLLIDPGQYTYEAKVLDLSSLTALDFVLITHEHADHLSVPFLKEIEAAFPDVTIVSNSSVVALLEKEDIQATTQDVPGVVKEDVPHEKLPMGEAPHNTMFTVFDKLTHPGDSHSFSQTSDILALPLTAPWGSITSAVDLALRLRPKTIIPIHDWHYKDEARKTMYESLTKFFLKEGIDFQGLETGETIEV